MERNPWLRVLLILLVIIAASYLAGIAWELAVRFADIVLLLALAWVLSFALDPVTQLLQTRTPVGRGLSVVVVYAGLLVVLSLATLLIVPIVAIQVSQIGVNLPHYVESAGDWFQAFEAWLTEKGIAMTGVGLDFAQTAQRIESLGPVIVNNALGLATGVASLLFSLVLVLMLSFYMTLDGSRLTEAFLGMIPKDRRGEANYLFLSTHRAFGGFIRGQLLQAIIYAVGTIAVMTGADLPYVAVVGIFAFAIMMIPFIGPVLAIIPPIAIAGFVHPDRAWWVFLLLLALQQLVLNVLAPKIMSQSVGIHPLLVLLALLIGAKLAGMWGAIFAVPVAAVIVAMVGFYRMTMEERAQQLDEQPEGGGRQGPDGQPASMNAQGGRSLEEGA